MLSATHVLPSTLCIVALIVLAGVTGAVRVPEAEPQQLQQHDDEAAVPGNIEFVEDAPEEERLTKSTLEDLLHRLHNDKRRIATDLGQCSMLMDDYKEIEDAVQLLDGATSTLAAVQQAKVDPNTAEDLVRVLDQSERTLHDHIHILIDSLPRDAAHGGRTPIQLPPLKAHLDSIAALCKSAISDVQARCLAWLAANPSTLGLDTTQHYVELAKAMYDSDQNGDEGFQSVEPIEEVSVNDMMQIVSQWIDDYVNGRERVIVMRGARRRVGVAEAISLSGLLQHMIRFSWESITRDASQVVQIPTSKVVWEHIADVVRDVREKRMMLQQVVFGVDMMLSRTHHNGGGAQQDAAPVAEAPVETPQQQAQAADDIGDPAPTATAVKAHPAPSALVEQLFAELRAKLQQATGGGGQGLQGGVRTSSAPSPPTVPEYVSVAWLERLFVRTTAAPSQHGDVDNNLDETGAACTAPEEAGVLPLPNHKSIRDAIGESPTTTLCSGSTAIITSNLTRREYPGVVELTVGNLASVAGIVDEALLFVYREWDTGVEEKLQLLSRAFAADDAMALTAPRWYGKEEGGCMPTIVPGMFDAWIPARGDNTVDERLGGEHCAPRTASSDRPIRIKRVDVAPPPGAQRQAPDDARPAHNKKQRNQIIMALDLASAGQIVPFLADLIEPRLFFFRGFTLGSAFPLPWTAENIREFTLKSISNGLMLRSMDELEARVLRSDVVENAVVFVVPDVGEGEFQQDSCTSVPDPMTLSAALLDDGNRLRLAVADACGHPCSVFMVGDRFGRLSNFPAALRVVVSDNEDDEDTVQAPLEWAFDTNSYLTHVDDLGVKQLRFVNKPQSDWAGEAVKLRLAVGCATPLYMLVIRKLSNGDPTLHIKSRHAVSALRFPGPTALTPRGDYGRHLGTHFVKFLRSIHKPLPGLIETPLTSRAFASTLRRHNPSSKYRWLYLAMVSGPRHEQLQCTNTLRRASMRMRDVQSQANLDSDDDMPVEGVSPFRFGVVNASTQPKFFHELGVAARYVGYGDHSHSTLLPPGNSILAEGDKQSSEADDTTCDAVVVHLPSATMEWWAGLPLAAMETLPLVLQDVLSARAPPASAKRQLLRDAQTAWRDHHGGQAGAPRPTPSDTVQMPLWPGWSVVPVGPRKFPALQYHYGARGKPAPNVAATPATKTAVVDVVLVYDASCALSMPALVGFQQLERCHVPTTESIQSFDDEVVNSGMLHVRRRGAYDVANVSRVQHDVPWAWDVLQDLVSSPAEVPLPIVLIGSNMSHTVTLPSPWTWGRQLWGYLDIMAAEEHQRSERWAAQQRSECDLAQRNLPPFSASSDDAAACEDTTVHSAAIASDWDALRMRCLVNGGTQRRERVAQRFRQGVRRPTA